MIENLKSSMQDQVIFEQFLRQHHSLQNFDASSNLPDPELYEASLISIRAHMGLTDGEYHVWSNNLKIVPGIADSLAPNFFVDRDQQFHYLIMHSGLFLAVIDLSLFCFAQADFFPELGDSNSEISPRAFQGQLPGLWLADVDVDSSLLLSKRSNRIIPKCEERLVLALYLSLLIARFFWFHGLYHCLNGHLGYVLENHLAPYLEEAGDGLSQIALSDRPSRLNEKERTRTFEALQLDADSSALPAALRVQLEGNENINGIAEMDLVQRTSLTYFACYAAVWFQEELNTHSTNSHRAKSTIGTRFCNLYATGIKKIDPTFPKLTNLHLAALQAWRKARNTVTETPFPEGRFWEKASFGGNLHLKDLRKEITRLSPKLDPHRQRPSEMT